MQRLLALAGLVLVMTFVSPARGATPSGLDLARQLNETFVGVAEKVSPSVVVIKVTQKSNPHDFGMDDTALEALPPELQKEFKRQREKMLDGHGSGIIVREDGYILTNGHVVEQAQKIRVRLKDGSEHEGEIRGVDRDADIAVIKIKGTNFPAAKLGNSDAARVGEFAIAIGAPFGLDYSVTFGHINAKGRADLDLQLMDQDFLQTDASINPGNSGGPLVNIEGEVIGINTLIRGLNRGVGFAIPINLAKEITEEIIAQGKFQRVWLGIAIRSVEELPEVMEQQGVKKGVVVVGIPVSGPAAKSSLDVQDIVTAVDGLPVNTVQQLRNAVRSKKAGDPALLDVVRDGKAMKLTLHVDRKPEMLVESTPPSVEEEEKTIPTLGLEVGALTADQQKKHKSGGVRIKAVADGSLAKELDIRTGEIITKFNKKKIANVADFEEAAKEADLFKGVTLTIEGSQGRRFETLKLNGR